jgi:hypothetical protein
MHRALSHLSAANNCQEAGLGHVHITAFPDAAHAPQNAAAKKSAVPFPNGL